MQTVAEVGADAPIEEIREASERTLRANTHSLLAALFAAPPGEILLSRVASAACGEGDLGRAWGALAEAAAEADPDSVDDEYHDLFIGVGRGQVMPYGSWYLSGFLMDRPLAVLREDLTRLGFQRSEGVREPEDHVAALLEVMALIASDDVDLAVQRRFFEHHLDSWMGRFFEDLERAPAARFYAALSRFGGRFLTFERQFLNMLA